MAVSSAREDMGSYILTYHKYFNNILCVVPVNNEVKDYIIEAIMLAVGKDKDNNHHRRLPRPFGGNNLQQRAVWYHRCRANHGKTPSILVQIQNNKTM